MGKQCYTFPMNKQEKRRRRILRESIFTVCTTLVLLGVSLLTFAWFHHARPTKRESAGILIATTTPYVAPIETLDSSVPEASLEPDTTPAPTATPAPTPVDLMTTYGHLFSTETVKTDSSYKSSNVSISIEKVQYGSGDSAVYYLADIYIGDIRCLKTVLAEDTYGKGIRESVKNMAARGKGILAITGDTYGNQDAGIVIRNGVIHRQEQSDFDVCVVYQDSTMETYSPSAFSLDEAISRGAWQAWSFGPMLLDGEGNPLPDSELNTSKNIRRANPRVGIGYYAPGHYCFIVVDGRTDDASGLTLEEFAQLFASLGCKAAYNLDGGRSSFMVYDGSVLNDPYKGGRSVSDCILITDTIEE